MTHLLATAQWPTLIAALIGYVAPHVTTLLHRDSAPDWLIALSAHVLAAAATAVTTVVVHPGDPAKVVLGNIGVAILGAVAGHKTSNVAKDRIRRT